MAFEYGDGARVRARHRRWGRRPHVLLGLQAVALVVVAAGVLVVSRPPAQGRPTAQQLRGRALWVLDGPQNGVRDDRRAR